MLIYFVKATYTGNVYKASDFYSNISTGAYNLNANKSIDVLLEVSDGLVVTKPIKNELPDGSNIEDYTHIIVPSKKTIYKIRELKYVNASQTIMILEDDALIANLAELRNKPIILERTNYQPDLKGLIDIPRIGIKDNVTVNAVSGGQYLYGKWALLYFSPDIKGQTVTFDFGSTDDFAEETDSLVSVLNKYPEIYVSSPDVIDYYQKVVKVKTGDGPFDYEYYQCEFIPGATGQGYVRWVICPNNLGAFKYTTTINAASGTFIINTLGDIDALVIALPFSFNLHNYANSTVIAKVPSYLTFTGVDKTEFLQSIKIVDSRTFTKVPTSKTVWSYNSVTRKGTMYIPKNLFWLPSDKVGSLDIGKIGIPALNYIPESDLILNIDRTEGIVSTKVPEHLPPFKTYKLNVYGNLHPIHPLQMTELKIKFAPTSQLTTYKIYQNSEDNVIGSGSFTHQIRFTGDKLDIFNQNNPTYKDQFNATQQKSLIQGLTNIGTSGLRAGVGAALATGGNPVGAIAGAAIGMVSSGVNLAINQSNAQNMERLREIGLQNAPDTIYGDLSDIQMILNSKYGIYWVDSVPSESSSMKMDLDLRGFPTAANRTISSMTYTANSIYGEAIIVKGQIYQIIKNAHVTDEINKKLSQGVTLVP